MPHSVTVCVTSALLLVVLPVFWRVLSADPGRSSAAVTCRQAFPWWGWAGLALGVVSWVLAWTRFPWFAACQPFTFTPQWLAYIWTLRCHFVDEILVFDRG